MKQSFLTKTIKLMWTLDKWQIINGWMDEPIHKNIYAKNDAGPL